MKVLVTEADRFVLVTGRAPEVGRHYVLEEAETATAEQSRAFHGLLQEYWRSGMHSSTATSFEEFREFVKRDLGAGFERFVYIDPEDLAKGLQDAPTWEAVPEHIRKHKARNALMRGRLKSWRDYTKKERTSTIENLISEMRQAGVNTRKFDEILEGMGATA